MKWIARIILAVLVVALFIPWEPVMVPLEEGGTVVPFGVVLLMVFGCVAAVAIIVLALLWLLTTAGWVKR